MYISALKMWTLFFEVDSGPKKIIGQFFLKPVCIFLKDQTAWVGKEDITAFVKNLMYYRQFVSTEIYKIANTPFLGCFFFLATENPVLAFSARVAGQ